MLNGRTATVVTVFCRRVGWRRNVGRTVAVSAFVRRNGNVSGRVVATIVTIGSGRRLFKSYAVGTVVAFSKLTMSLNLEKREIPTQKRELELERKLMQKQVCVCQHCNRSSHKHCQKKVFHNFHSHIRIFLMDPRPRC